MVDNNSISVTYLLLLVDQRNTFFPIFQDLTEAFVSKKLQQELRSYFPPTDIYDISSISGHYIYINHSTFQELQYLIHVYVT